MTKTTYYAVTRTGRHIMTAGSDEDAVSKAVQHNGLRRERLNSFAFERTEIRRIDREVVTTVRTLTDG